MNPIGSNILATVVGLLVGSAVNMAIISLNTALHPMPEGIDPNDMAQFRKYVETLPVSALLAVMLAHLGQAFVGGWVAARLAATRPMALAMIVGSLSLVGGLMMMMMVPHPAWMWIELPLYLVVAWAGAMIELKRRWG
jgi:hypothetical protein